jgi:hypothetical protein
LRVSIAITMALPAVPQPSNDRCCFCGSHNLASDGLSARDVIVVSPHSGRPRPPSAMPIATDAGPATALAAAIPPVDLGFPPAE